MEKSFKDVPAWEDDFAMDEIIDKNTWSMENHFSDTYCAYFTPRKENVRIEDDVLKICLLREDYNSAKRTSASLKCKKVFNGGIIEVEAKLPHGSGVWAAIWLKAENGHKIHGEIDMAEHVGWYNTHKYQTNIHIVANARKQFAKNVMATVTEYHTYGVEWYKDRIAILLDGNTVHELRKSDVEVWPFDSIGYHLILSLNYGGWAGNPNYNDTTPYVLEVRNVKYYDLL